ncbi:hypothetical protein [Pyrodictium delaneyi]|uniref:Cdc6 C-terminal domain-containing protein n=1 Tax=Pyrodictium delaneyi TaxID=1273541 RepID=A0A211YMI5_9CREN|nr:hypothetical protein [Pyrodictium delaneyi]OWJ54176.1 hypothetical protein Pdsh_10050 [Pyrodictium delaneyi]
MTTQALYELSAFSESERRTLRLIAEYLANKKKGRRGCFVYKYLRIYYERRGWENVVEWHTVERNIRRLAELGLLRRIQLPHRGANRVLFCLSEGLERLLAKLGWLKHG